MLGFSFPPSTLGVLACVGLVPLLIVLADLDDITTNLQYGYVAFLVFHVITLNWTGGYEHGNDVYMMIAGAATMLAHPAFYFIPILSYYFIRKHLGGRLALVMFPVLWVAYEYLHSLSEWSFPWLTLGNSQSYDFTRIQFISATGVYGLSLWIVIINVFAFDLYSRIAHGVWKAGSGKSIGYAVGILLLYFLPAVHGTLVLATAPSIEPGGLRGGQETIRVGMIQSNIDPWEKWRKSGNEIMDLYLKMTEDLVEGPGHQRPDLVLWPETAVGYYILLEQNKPILQRIRDRLDKLATPVLTGTPHAVFYEDSTKAPPSAKRTSRGERYDSFNAAAFIQPGVDSIAWYGKMKMVPIAERVPYADAFQWLDFLRWGVGIGGWQLGPDSTIFVERKTGTRFCTMICYESVYPGFVADFVRKGAEFIGIITIDSWWGRMSGAFQHHQFAIFRAVENRRWITRCAVGGMSSFIDPYGRVYDKTELFTQTSVQRTIGREVAMSFYTEHGDWLGTGCLFGSGLVIAAAAGKKFKERKRKLEWGSS